MASKQCTSYMEEMLTCSVCLELVKEPQTLTQCFHNYCKSCTHQMIQTQKKIPPGVMCPLCSTFSAEGEIRNNHFVNDLLGLHSKIKGEGKPATKPYEQCEVDKPSCDAKWRCMDCRASICHQCKAAHQRLKGHRILELTEETDLVVDKLVFCGNHVDKILKLYCSQCRDVICMMCQVVTHKVHDTVTVEQALDTILPEVDQNLEGLGVKLEEVSKAIEHTDEVMGKSDVAYNECVDRIDKITDERVQQIRKEQTKIKDQLKHERELQKKHFHDTRSELVNLHKKLSNLQKVTTMSVNKARHVTLLQELLQGGLYERLQSVNRENDVSRELQINMPTLDIDNTEWSEVVTQGLLGRVKFSKVRVRVGKVSGKEYVGNSGLRYWKEDFRQVFSKPLKQTLKIELPSDCGKVTVCDDKVWAPIWEKNVIQVYNRQGQVQKSIDIYDQPVCVENSSSGEMLVCCWDTGLFVLTEDCSQPVNIDRGKYSDMCMYGHEVYVWDYSNTQIVEFVRADTGWKRQDRVVKIEIGNSGGCSDTLLVRQCEGSKAGVEFFVGLYDQHTIVRVSEEGEQISQYGGQHVQGEGRLYYPCVCGVDSVGQLLVADAGHNKYKVVNIETGEWSTVFTGDDAVYDAKVEDEHTVWFSRQTGDKWVITKHDVQG